MPATPKNRYAFGMERMPRFRELMKNGRIVASGPASGPVSATAVPRRFALARRRRSAQVRPAGAVLRFHVV